MKYFIVGSCLFPNIIDNSRATEKIFTGVFDLPILNPEGFEVGMSAELHGMGLRAFLQVKEADNTARLLIQNPVSDPEREILYTFLISTPIFPRMDTLPLDESPWRTMGFNKQELQQRNRGMCQIIPLSWKLVSSNAP